MLPISDSSSDFSAYYPEQTYELGEYLKMKVLRQIIHVDGDIISAPIEPYDNETSRPFGNNDRPINQPNDRPIEHNQTIDWLTDGLIGKLHFQQDQEDLQMHFDRQVGRGTTETAKVTWGVR